VLAIHLRRTGAKKDPHYRVVVADSRAARDGAFIEILGHYHPRYQPAKVVLDVQKTKDWIAKGAQPSDTVKSLLKQMESGTVETQQPVAPSRQRDAAQQSESRTKEPAVPELEAETEPEAEAEVEAEVEPEPEPEPEAEAGADVEAEAEVAAEPEAAAEPEEEAEAEAVAEPEAEAEAEVAAEAEAAAEPEAEAEAEVAAEPEAETE
jgi:ribosomal protein S16